MKHLKTFEGLVDPLISDIFNLWNLARVIGPIEHEFSDKFENDLRDNSNWEKEDFIDDHGYVQIYLCSGKDSFGEDWQGTGEYTHGELEDIEDIETGFDLNNKIDKQLDVYLKSIGLEYSWVKKSLSERYLKTESVLHLDEIRKIFELNKIKDPRSKDFAYILKYTFGDKENFINLWYYKLNNGSYFFTVD
jgi:hypothetical protein